MDIIDELKERFIRATEESVIVHTVLGFVEQGACDKEHALKVAVVLLHEENKRLRQDLAIRHMLYGDYVFPECQDCLRNKAKKQFWGKGMVDLK